MTTLTPDRPWTRRTTRFARTFLTGLAAAIGVAAGALSGYRPERALTLGAIAFATGIAALAIRTPKPPASGNEG